MDEDPFSEELPDLYLSQLLQGSNQKEFAPSDYDQDSKNGPTKKHLQFLSKNFGHRNFRPMQWKIISSILYKKRDNLAIMTTGYGKSLCFQYPSAFKNSVTLVISPLISLMEDQVLSLTVSSVPACLLGTAQSQSKEVIDKIFKNLYRIVYLTPEYCTGDVGKDLLKKMKDELEVTLIAVDEAHCVTSWGHDFRFSYRQLSVLKEIFPSTPLLAVTATATPKVKSDIINVLKLENPQVLCTGFDRPNLCFSVFPKGEIFKDLTSLMVRQKGKWIFPGSTIIYCLTRQQTEIIRDLLKHHDIECVTYHAGMSLKERKKAHENFVKDKVPVIAATIAFGMGIDKPDIRLIIHYGASGSIEGYYQEVGRAGRDGLPAKCVVFWSAKDFVTHSFLRKELPEESQTRKAAMADLMNDYLTSSKCRRHFILSHFEDNPNISVQHPKNCCDNCSQKVKKIDPHLYEGLSNDGMYDFTKDAVILLSAVNAIGGRFGLEKYILFLKGSKSAKIYDSWKEHKLHGSGAHKSDSWWKEISVLLLAEKLLGKKINSKGTYSYTSFHVTCAGNRFLNDSEIGVKLCRKPPKAILEMLRKPNVPDRDGSGWLSVGSSKMDLASFKSKSEKEPERGSSSNSELLKIYHKLLNKRGEIARETNAMPYAIASNAGLMELAKKLPKNLEELRNIRADSFTEAKIITFGPHFLKIINDNSKTSDKLEAQPIEVILKDHPLEKSKMNPSVITTYTLYKSGHHSLDEIASARKMTKGTIVGHLVDAMKSGYPVTLLSLGVTNDDLNTIIGAINKLETGYKHLTLVKLSCPDHITYEQIKVVSAYLGVRDHLKNLGIPYVEFDEYSYDQIECSQISLTHVGASQESKSKLNVDYQNDFVLNDDQNDLLLAACHKIESTNNECSSNNRKINKEDDDAIFVDACSEVDSIDNECRTDKRKVNDLDDDLILNDDQDDSLLAACSKVDSTDNECSTNKRTAKNLNDDLVLNNQDDFLLAASSKGISQDDLLSDDKDELLLAACEEFDSVTKKDKTAKDCFNEAKVPKSVSQTSKASFEFNDDENDCLIVACAGMEHSLEEEDQSTAAFNVPPSKKVKSDIDRFSKLTEKEDKEADSKPLSNSQTSCSQKPKKQNLPPWLTKKRVTHKQ